MAIHKEGWSWIWACRWPNQPMIRAGFWPGTSSCKPHTISEIQPLAYRSIVLFLCDFSRSKCKFFIIGSWKWWKHEVEGQCFYCFQVFEISDEKRSKHPLFGIVKRKKINGTVVDENETELFCFVAWILMFKENQLKCMCDLDIWSKNISVIIIWVLIALYQNSCKRRI